MDDNLCPNCETYGLVDHQDRIECKNVDIAYQG
jgi:ribosomal protein S27AE